MNKQSYADVRKKVERLSSLPTIPPVATKILKLIGSENISLNKVTEFISRDQALSARVLKIINSPVYGFPGRISSISQAVMLIGIGALKGMLLGISMFDMMHKTMMGLWEHSIGTAVAAKAIATKVGMKEIEDVSVAGLIHDIGKVALGICYPELYKNVIIAVGEKKIYIVEAEENIIGANHAEAGSWLARKWRFPLSLVNSIEYHHNPSARHSSMTIAIVHLSDTIIKMMGFGFSGDPFAHRIERIAWDTLALTGEDLKGIFIEIEEAILSQETSIF
ncbi:MAG: HDOD domain-containing protein [Epsilonproteobacteria bacterium]|nr:HDOD domain-containing protein [Campylobacterota bacterium]